MKKISFSKIIWSSMYNIIDFILLILGIINIEIPQNSNNKIFSFIIANKFFLILFISFITSIVISINQVIKENEKNTELISENEKKYLEEIKNQKEIINLQNEKINLQNEKIKQLENNKALNENSLSQLEYEVIEEW